jgi:glycosyltransferase involved in cell wall biosynthesis
MKIIWVVPGFQSDPTDRCIPALTDLAHRVAAEHSLKVFALQYPGRDDCYRVGRVEVQSFRHEANSSRLSRLGPLARALRQIRAEPGDLLHAFWAAEPALVGLVANTLKRRPLIVSCMGGEPVYLPRIGYGAAGKRLDRFYLRRAAAGAAIMTAGSQVQAALLKARFGPRLAPVVMPLGVDLNRFEAGAAKALPERPLALAVGALLPVKGQANLLEAVAGLPRLRLRIVGEGPEREHLQALIRALRLQDRVELAGNLNPDDMPAEYRAADLLALPSYYESQSMALLEGLACGLPVVAAPVGLAPALLADGQAGELAGDNSPASLAGALCRLLARSLEWPQLQQEARRRAADFSLEVCAGRLIKLYHAVLEKRD